MDLRHLTIIVLIGSAGCARHDERASAVDTSTPLPVSVLADSALRLSMPGGALAGAPSAPPRLTLQRVSPTRAALELPAPDAPASPPSHADPESTPREGLAVDESLRPPLPMSAEAFVLRGARRGWVELDVRVDEQGQVSDAMIVAAAADSATQAAALEAAYAVRFHPAIQRGRPVAVWSRQRFEVGKR